MARVHRIGQTKPVHVYRWEALLPCYPPPFLPLVLPLPSPFSPPCPSGAEPPRPSCSSLAGLQLQNRRSRVAGAQREQRLSYSQHSPVASYLPFPKHQSLPAHTAWLLGAPAGCAQGQLLTPFPKHQSLPAPLPGSLACPQAVHRGHRRGAHPAPRREEAVPGPDGEPRQHGGCAARAVRAACWGMLGARGAVLQGNGRGCREVIY